MKKDNTVYRRNLPHIQPIGATFFVTCSLKGAIPKAKLLKLKEAYEKSYSGTNLPDDQQFNDHRISKFTRKYLLRIRGLIDEQEGPYYLSDPDIARILLARIESYHMRYYRLLALTIMSNHFHMLIDTSVQIKSMYEPGTTPDNYVQLDKIMNLIKGGSARYINQLRGTTGEQVWENESYDIYMRNEKMVRNVVAYILNNPVKAGIVKKYEDHPFTFARI